MAEKIYESVKNKDGKFELECSECYFPNVFEDAEAEKDDVFECKDCGAPFTIVDVTEDKIQFKPVVFDEEEWRE